MSAFCQNQRPARHGTGRSGFHSAVSQLKHAISDRSKNDQRSNPCQLTCVTQSGNTRLTWCRLPNLHGKPSERDTPSFFPPYSPSRKNKQSQYRSSPPTMTKLVMRNLHLGIRTSMRSHVGEKKTMLSIVCISFLPRRKVFLFSLSTPIDDRESRNIDNYWRDGELNRALDPHCKAEVFRWKRTKIPIRCIEPRGESFI